jgi:hypothetical protein
MTSYPLHTSPTRDDYELWVHSPLQLEAAFQETLRHGFAVIPAGFGYFAIFDGLTTTHNHVELPRAFALAATAIGVISFIALSRLP